MSTRTMLAGLAAGAALLCACGSDGGSSSSTEAPPATAAPSGSAASGGSTGGAPVVVKDSALGQILTDASGRTVYGFTKDTAGTPTCSDGCAESWPAVLVDSAELPAGLDASVFSVVERPDDTYQLKAGDWPLYLFSGDAAPGQTNGQGVSEVWYVVGPDGALIKG